MNAHAPPAKRFANISDNFETPEDYQEWYNEQLENTEQFEPPVGDNIEGVNIEATNEENKEESNFLEDTEWVSSWFE